MPLPALAALQSTCVNSEVTAFTSEPLPLRMYIQDISTQYALVYTGKCATQENVAICGKEPQRRFHALSRQPTHVAATQLQLLLKCKCILPYENVCSLRYYQLIVADSVTLQHQDRSVLNHVQYVQQLLISTPSQHY